MVTKRITIHDKKNTNRDFFIRYEWPIATGTAKLTIGVDNTAGKQRRVNISVMLVPALGRNLLSSSAALAIGVDTTISAFPALKAKGETFPLRHNHIFTFWTQSYRNCRANASTSEKRPA